MAEPTTCFCFKTRDGTVVCDVCQRVPPSVVSGAPREEGIDWKAEYLAACAEIAGYHQFDMGFCQCEYCADSRASRLPETPERP